MILHPAKQNQVWGKIETFSYMQGIMSLMPLLLENYLRICLNETNELFRMEKQRGVLKYRSSSSRLTIVHKLPRGPWKTPLSPILPQPLLD